MPAVLEVIKPGLLTTVQDLGRHGYQRFGVSVSGAMDTFSHRIANRLVGNDEGAATLECALLGPTLRFLSSTALAIAGGDLSPQLDGGAIPMWQSTEARAGSVLSFGECRDGCRAYVAVCGGIDVPRVLGSRSTHARTRLGGVEGRALRKGDVLSAFDSPGPGGPRKFKADYFEWAGSHRIRALQGPQFEDFDAHAGADFVSGRYRVTTHSDRMGLRLEGPKLSHRGSADIVSDAVPFGTVQVPANGQPIILAADRQTTGGYPKIAVVIAADFPAVAQLKPGDEIRFAFVRRAEAMEALRFLENEIVKVV